MNKNNNDLEPLGETVAGATEAILKETWRMVLYEVLHEITSGPVILEWRELSPGQQFQMAETADYILANPGTSALDAHVHWRQGMTEHGWKYGETKDWITKTHPFMVGFTSLPAKHRLQLELFVKVIEGWREWESNLEAHQS